MARPSRSIYHSPLWTGGSYVSSAAAALSPLHSLALQRPHGRFGSLLRSLRCKNCGQRPQRVALVGHAYGTGAPGGWRIEVTLPGMPFP